MVYWNESNPPLEAVEWWAHSSSIRPFWALRALPNRLVAGPSRFSQVHLDCWWSVVSIPSSSIFEMLIEVLPLTMLKDVMMVFVRRFGAELCSIEWIMCIGCIYLAQSKHSLCNPFTINNIMSFSINTSRSSIRPDEQTVNRAPAAKSQKAILRHLELESSSFLVSLTGPWNRRYGHSEHHSVRRQLSAFRRSSPSIWRTRRRTRNGRWSVTAESNTINRSVTHSLNKTNLRRKNLIVASQSDFGCCAAKIQSLRRNNGIRSNVASQTYIVAPQSRTSRNVASQCECHQSQTYFVAVATSSLLVYPSYPSFFSMDVPSSSSPNTTLYSLVFSR